MPTKIFLSYSSFDREFVKEIRTLLCSAIDEFNKGKLRSRDLIFFDEESLTPGDQWKEEIDKAISDCEKMYVFWSRNSAASPEVKREYRLAIEQSKRVVPVLIDRTSLPKKLADLHSINLIGTIKYRDFAVQGCIAGDSIGIDAVLEELRTKKYSFERVIRATKLKLLELFADDLGLKIYDEPVKDDD